NIGIGLARNELMRASQSDFIHFQDADDCFDPAWCGKIREQIAGGDVDIVLNNVAVVTLPMRQKRPDWLYPFHRLGPGDDLLLFFLKEVFYILVSMVTFRRRHGLENGGFLPRGVIAISEDYEFFTRLFALKLRHRALNEPLTIKHRRPKTLTNDHELAPRREVFVSRLQVGLILQSWLPPFYHPYLAKFFLKSGSSLIKEGLLEEARTCLRLTEELDLSRPLDGLADLYSKNGAHFFRAGDIRHARQAFERARRLGPALYENASGPYRLVARSFGPEFAEQCAYLYRELIPEAWRMRMRSLS
ncbi:MAG: glycosyltransferase, partial [Candidatus Omnitrophota bacterium]